MADVSYTNPASLMPQTNWKPSGFLAGDIYAKQEMDYHKALELSQASQQLGLAKSGAEFQDYLSNAPVRQAQRGLDLSRIGAETPIQGDLARGLASTARATSITAEPNAKQQLWKNDKEKHDHAMSLLGDRLSAVVSQLGDDPTQAQIVWRDQIVPQLEQQMGEKIPDQYKNMSLQQMKLMSQALTMTGKVRGDALIHSMDNTSREGIAATQANAQLEGHRIDATSRAGQERPAQIKSEAAKRHEAVLTQQYQAQGMSPELAQRKALTDTNQLFYGGNPFSRGDASVDAAYGATGNKISSIDKISARDMPKDSADLNERDTYKKVKPNGTIGYYKFDRARKGFIELK